MRRLAGNQATLVQASRFKRKSDMNKSSLMKIVFGLSVLALLLTSCGAAVIVPGGADEVAATQVANVVADPTLGTPAPTSGTFDAGDGRTVDWSVDASGNIASFQPKDGLGLDRSAAKLCNPLEYFSGTCQTSSALYKNFTVRVKSQDGKYYVTTSSK